MSTLMTILAVIVIWYIAGGIVVSWLDNKYYKGRLFEWIDAAESFSCIIVMLFPLVVWLHIKTRKETR